MKDEGVIWEFVDNCEKGGGVELDLWVANLCMVQFPQIILYPGSFYSLLYFGHE